MPLNYCDLASVKARLGLTDVDATRDAQIQTYVDSSNTLVERKIGCAIGPSADTVRLYDGYAVGQAGLFVRDGVQTLTKFEYGTISGGSWTQADITTVLLRPMAANREPDWPAQYVSFQDISPDYFYPGDANLRLTGTFGFSAIPADLKDVANTTAVRAWLSRRTGETDVAGYDEAGNPMISRFLSPDSKQTLIYYRNGTRNWYRRSGR